MTRAKARRTSGMAKYIVGAAIAQEIIHEVIQNSTMALSQPSTR